MCNFCECATIYVYYVNLTPDQQLIIHKCHRHRNTLYDKVLVIIGMKIKNIYSLYELLNKALSSLFIRQLNMIVDNKLPVSLDRYINYEGYHTFLDPKMCFPHTRFTACVRYTAFLHLIKSLLSSDYFH